MDFLHFPPPILSLNRDEEKKAWHTLSRSKYITEYHGSAGLIKNSWESKVRLHRRCSHHKS